jgi:hypothetical protein
MKFGCVFGEFAKRTLATRKDKIKIIKKKRDGYVTCLRLALSVSCEERWERQAGCVAVSFRLDYLYLILSCSQLHLCEFPKRTTAPRYKYDMQMFCTSDLLVNQHFPGLPSSGTHCIYDAAWDHLSEVLHKSVPSVITSIWNCCVSLSCWCFVLAVTDTSAVVERKMLLVLPRTSC